MSPSPNTNQDQDSEMRGLLLVFQSTIERLNATIDQLNVTLGGLRQDLAQKEEEVSKLKRMLFGQKSEHQSKTRVPSPKSQLKKPSEEFTEEELAAKRQKTKEKRARKKEERRKKLPLIEKIIKVPSEEQTCTACGRSDRFAKYTDQISERIEHVPEHLVRYKIIRQRVSCRCGGCILTAPPPPSVSDGVQFGPGLHAHVVTAKCADSMPLNRQAKSLRRAGAEISTRTLGDLFHRSADMCCAIYNCILECIAAAEHVRSDETKIPVKAKGKCLKRSMWVFIAGNLVAFVYSTSPGQKTPEAILEGTSGILQSDGHHCYNSVCEPQGSRVRAGCWAHARRKFFDSQGSFPQESDHAISEILALYEVEYRAAELGILGSKKHRLLRQMESEPIIKRFKIWLKEQSPPPKSLLGKAITYTLNQFETLSAFLNDEKISLDNNESERALRIIALGRKNFLFVGNDQAGKNLAILQTIVSTCLANKVNPYEYLRDILIRVNTHPASQIRDLLPDRWQPSDREDILRPKISS